MAHTQEHDLEQQRNFLASLRRIQGFPRDSGEVTTESNVLAKIRTLEAALGIEVTPELTDAENLANQLSVLTNKFNVSRNKQARAGFRAQIRELQGIEPEAEDDADCFIFANIWGWFAVPLGAIAVPIGAFIGLSSAYYVLTLDVKDYYFMKNKPNDMKDAWGILRFTGSYYLILWFYAWMAFLVF